MPLGARRIAAGGAPRRKRGRFLRQSVAGAEVLDRPQDNKRRSASESEPEIGVLEFTRGPT